ncbi:MAG TPA: 5-deoxy-glucuronate isomerase [Candidatus Limnocylindrales bacterium]|jgi:5-deoxy-glucuronate isomerase
MDPDASVASPLLRRATAPDVDGRLNGVTPASAGWEYVQLAIHQLGDGMAVSAPADARERLVVVLEGNAWVAADDHALGVFGSRTTVFDGPPPPVVLLEPGRSVGVVGAGPDGALVAIAAAPGGEISRTVAFGPGQILAEQRGSGRTARRIHHLLPPTEVAGRLIAFEAFTPGGNWSSWPPHKHDTEDPPTEARLEELYYYRFAQPQGFAVQRVYTSDGSLDETVTARDHDIVLVPHGYHPVAAAVGYDCYYLNVMAGPSRQWRFTLDPDHAWSNDWNPVAPEIRR